MDSKSISDTQKPQQNNELEKCLRSACADAAPDADKQLVDEHWHQLSPQLRMTIAALILAATGNR